MWICVSIGLRSHVKSQSVENGFSSYKYILGDRVMMHKCSCLCGYCYEKVIECECLCLCVCVSEQEGQCSYKKGDGVCGVCVCVGVRGCAWVCVCLFHTQRHECVHRFCN